MRKIRRVLGVVAVVSLIFAACSTNVEESEEYQTLLAERDSLQSDLTSVGEQLNAVQAELAGANVALGEKQDEVGSLSTDLATANSSVDLLRDDLGTAHEAFECIHEAEAPLWLEWMWVTEDFYDELVAWGFPVELGDEILDSIDSPWWPWKEYADSSSFFEWGERVRAVGDPDVNAAWQRFLDAPIGSDEESLSNVEFDMRLEHIKMSCIADGLRATTPG